MKSNFVYQRINRSPPVGHFYFGFLAFSEKNPVCRDRTHVPTCQKVTRCRLSYRGRPAFYCTLVNRHAGTPDKKQKQNRNDVVVHHQTCVRVRVCVFFPFILDIKFVGRTSRGHTGGRSHYRISHPPSFCGACLVFSRKKDSAIPFPRRP